MKFKFIYMFIVIILLMIIERLTRLVDNILKTQLDNPFEN